MWDLCSTRYVHLAIQFPGFGISHTNSLYLLYWIPDQFTVRHLYLTILNLSIAATYEHWIRFCKMMYILTWEDKMPKLRKLHYTQPSGLSTCLHWANKEHGLWVSPPSPLVILVGQWLCRQHSKTQSWGWCWSWWTPQSASGCWQQCMYWGINSGGRSGDGTQHRGGSDGLGEGKPADTLSSILSQCPHQLLLAPPSVVPLPAQCQGHLKEWTASICTKTS